MRDAANTTEPRVAVRTNGSAGFVFVNNYVRQLSMPARPNFQTHIKLDDREVTIPATPITVPSDSYFAWPFNLRLGSHMLNYATAQLLTQLDTPDGKLFVFFAVPGIAPEFSFDAAASSQATIHPTPGLRSTFTLTDASGVKSTFLVLTEAEAEHAAILHLGKADHLVLTASDVFSDGDTIHLRSTAGPTQNLSLYPDVSLGRQGRRNGLFTEYTFTQQEKHPVLAITQTQTAAPRQKMLPGPYFDWRKRAIPAEPPLAAFDDASVWRLRWQKLDLTGLSNVLLQIDYTGDIARLSSPTTLLDDNFYNGLPWQICVTRFGPHDDALPLTLRILPMPRVAQIYLDTHARDKLDRSQDNPGVVKAQLIPEYESILHVSP